MSNLQDIFAAAQSLPAAERGQLILALWDAMPMEEWPQPSADWIGEANHRSDVLDAGEMIAIPWPEARKIARRQAGLDG